MGSGDRMITATSEMHLGRPTAQTSSRFADTAAEADIASFSEMQKPTQNEARAQPYPIGPGHPDFV